MLAENGHVGLCYGNASPLNLSLVLGGGQLFPEDRSYGTEAVGSLLQLIADLMNDGSIPAGMMELGVQGCEQLFLDGQVGILFASNSKAVAWQNATGVANIGYVNLPTPIPGQQYTPVAGGSVLMVADRDYTPEKETAVRSLFDYLNDPQQVAEYCVSRGVLPVRYSVLDEVMTRIDLGEIDAQLASFWPYWLAAADHSVTAGPQDPNNAVWAAGISEGVNAILSGSSVEEAIQVATNYYAANRQ